MKRLVIVVSFILLMNGAIAAPPSWDFSSGLGDWIPNDDLTSITVKGGVVEMDAIGPDPTLHNIKLNFQASPWQYVVARLKANHSGNLELFWSGKFEGPYNGFDCREIDDHPHDWRWSMA